MSKSIFSYTANGNLAKVLSGGVIAGGKGVNEYYLVMDEGNRCEDNWLPTDIVLVVFKRPDGEVSTPQVMSYHSDGYWRMTSSGWETDVDIGDTASSLLVSFHMRRYSTVSAGRFVETTPTDLASIPLYPSNNFTPMEIADSEADSILAAMSDVQDDVGGISEILGAIIDGEQITCGDSTLIDNLTTTQSGIGALDARQGYMLDKKKADLEYVNGELTKKPSVTQLNEKVGKAEFEDLRDKVDGLTGGGGQSKKYELIKSYKAPKKSYGGEVGEGQVCEGIVFDGQIPMSKYSAYHVRVLATHVGDNFVEQPHYIGEGVVLNNIAKPGEDSIASRAEGRILVTAIPLLRNTYWADEDQEMIAVRWDGGGYMSQQGMVLVRPTVLNGIHYTGFDIEIYGSSWYESERDPKDEQGAMDLYIEVFGIL